MPNKPPLFAPSPPMRSEHPPGQVQRLSVHMIDGESVPAPRLYQVLEPYYQNYDREERDYIVQDLVALNWSLFEVPAPSSPSDHGVGTT